MAQNLAFNNDNESERTKRTNESERSERQQTKRTTTTNEANKQTNDDNERPTTSLPSGGLSRWVLGAGRWALGAGWLAGCGRFTLSPTVRRRRRSLAVSPHKSSETNGRTEQRRRTRTVGFLLLVL